MSTKNNTRHLRQLTPEERREFFNSFDTILCDCDGVIWLIVSPIPRSGEALQLMKDRGKQVRFVSNNSLRSDNEYMEKFAKLGIRDVKVDDVIHPAKTIIWYLNKYRPNAKVFPLIAQKAQELLVDNGIDAVPVDIDANQLDCVTFTKYMLQKEKVDAVIVDINVYTGFTHLMKALQYLKDPQCELILGAMDSLLPLTPDLIIPAYLDFYDIITKHSQKQPVILGKPSALLGDFMKDHFAITDPKRCLFIGDSLRMDICFAKSVGFQTLFVLTGSDSAGSMFSGPDECKPDYYTEGVVDFIDLFSE